MFRTTMGAAHFDAPMPEQDEHLGPGGSVVIAMYTIAVAFHEFVLGLMSGRPSVLEPAILFGAAGLGLTCVLYLWLRWGYINFWHSLEHPLTQTTSSAEKKQRRKSELVDPLSISWT